MKKISMILLIIAITAGLISCGGGKPKDMDDKTYNIGIQASRESNLNH